MVKPEPIVRAALYSVVIALSIATAASCLNVLKKRDEDIEHAQAAASKLGISIDINTDKLDHPGEALAAACFFSFLLMLFYIGHSTYLAIRSRKHPSACGFYRPPFYYVLMPIATVFLLGTAIATTIVGKNDSAQITARIGATVLPAATVAASAARLGINPEYWTKDYVRRMAILSWPTFAVTLITTIYTFFTARRQRNVAPVVPNGGATETAPLESPELKA